MSRFRPSWLEMLLLAAALCEAVRAVRRIPTWFKIVGTIELRVLK
jgi:hypothetical protein